MDIKRVTYFIVMALVAGALLVSPGLKQISQANEKDKIVIVSQRKTFSMTGCDPATAVGGEAQSIISFFADGLVDKDKDGKVLPALAESWKWSDDGLSVTFSLRKGIKFHNGDALTAEDVKFSFERYTRKNFRHIYGAELRRTLNKVSVNGDYSVTLYFNNRYPQIFDRICEYFKILPKMYIEKMGDAEYAKHPIAAGPFKVVKYEQDQWVEFEAVDNHYRKTPEVKHIRFALVPEHSTRLAMLKAGDADMIWVHPSQIKALKGDANIQLVSTRYTILWQLMFTDMLYPDKKLPFNDIRVRKALSFAIDRNAITKKILQSVAAPQKGVLAPFQPGYEPKIAAADPYDPAKAKALLREAGYPNGFDTQFTFFGEQKDACEAIAAYLSQVGIRAKMNIVDSGKWIELWRNRGKGIDGVFLANTWFNARNHPAGSLWSMYGKGQMYNWVEIPKVVELLQRSTELMLGDPELVTIARELNDNVLKNMPRVELWVDGKVMALGPRIEYWEGVTGLVADTRFEFIRLKK